MAQSIATDAAQASTNYKSADYKSAERLMDNARGIVRRPIIELVARTTSEGFSPATFIHFEFTLFAVLQEFGRLLMDALLNGRRKRDRCVVSCRFQGCVSRQFLLFTLLHCTLSFSCRCSTKDDSPFWR